MVQQNGGIGAEIGARIRAARKSIKMRQVDLSAATGLPASHLSDIERGVRMLTIPTLQKISQAINRPLEYFFQDIDNQPRSFGMVIPMTSVGGRAVSHFAALVAQRAEPEIKLRLYHSAELGSSRDQVEALIEGGIHIYIDEPHCFEKYAPLCGPVFLPYFFNDRAQYHRFLNSAVFQQQIVEPLLQKGIRILNPASNWELGSFEVLFSTDPVFTPQDLKDRRFRSYPSAAACRLRRFLGAEPVVVEWERIDAAFEKGEIDTVLIPASYFGALKLQRTARYATLLRTGYTLNLTVAISEREFSKISPQAQAVLADNCKEAGIHCTRMANRQTEADLSALTDVHGMPLICPNPDAWRTAFKAGIQEICRQDDMLRETCLHLQRL